MKRIVILVISLMMIGLLSACNSTKGNSNDSSQHGESMTSVDNLKKAENPKYPVGTNIVLTTDHMEGMKDATGTVSGVYDTTVYAVDYTPSDGGEEVKNHKWVIKEEFEDSENKTYAVGYEVTLKNGHMSNMGGKSVKAKIVEVVKGPVYMVDYKPTDGSKEVKNHQWVVESELEAAK